MAYLFLIGVVPVQYPVPKFPRSLQVERRAAKGHRVEGLRPNGSVRTCEGLLR